MRCNCGTFLILQVLLLLVAFSMPRTRTTSLKQPMADPRESGIDKVAVVS